MPPLLTVSALPVERILCLGAHCDDIEIGCGGTILKLLESSPGVHVDWIVFSSTDAREAEAKAGAARFLEGAGSANVVTKTFRERFFPYVGAEIKEYFDELGAKLRPDVVFTHFRDDLHQDHVLLAELALNTFRDHLILEYEIPKWDGDLGTPNVFVEADAAIAQRKIDLLHEHFASQRSRDWFDDQTFYSLLRIRGMECRSPSRLAEAFYARKLLFTAHTKRECCS
jgi:LmbE family N-acetylglucosaminyl deacetylase